jgi:hypothetical protein
VMTTAALSVAEVKGKRRKGREGRRRRGNEPVHQMAPLCGATPFCRRRRRTGPPVYTQPRANNAE